VVGSIQATETLKIILGKGQTLAGRLLLYNALEMSFNQLSYQANPDAPPITTLIDYEQFCRGDGAEAFERMDVDAIRAARAEGWQPYVLDVRTAEEAAVDRLAWSDALIPHDVIALRVAEIPRDRDILIHCKKGIRSAHAAAVLGAAGFDRVVNMNGGLDAWTAQRGREKDSSAT
jgi:adenylyltransferase/sulfurtransferase